MEERRTDTVQTFYDRQADEREEWVNSERLTPSQALAIRDLMVNPSAENRATVEAIARRLEQKLEQDDRTIRETYPLRTADEVPDWDPDTDESPVPEEADAIWNRTLKRYGQILRVLAEVDAREAAA